MRKVLFLMSHLGSGSSDLFDILCTDPWIDGFRTGLMYDHPEKLKNLSDSPHKRDNAHAIYMDELLHNRLFACKPLCNVCKFIFFFRKAKPSLNQILLDNPDYSPQQAANHYRYRLRGMYEYVLRTPGSIVLTWDELQSGRTNGIEEYLGLKQPLKTKQLAECHTEMAPGELVEECQEAYDRYIYAINEARSSS